jgi:hypothetical protein
MITERILEILRPFEARPQSLKGDVPDAEYPAVLALYDEWQELVGLGYIDILDVLYSSQSREGRLLKVTAVITEEGREFLASQPA